MCKKCFYYLFIMSLVSSLLVMGCSKGESVDYKLAQLEVVVQSHLLLVNSAVSDIINPVTQKQTTIPDYDTLYRSAGLMEVSSNPPKYLATILSLLGRANDFDCKVPDANKSLEFPSDHHLHSDMGLEWYYLGIYLDAIDPDGISGRIGLVLSMQKQRIIGLTTQTKFAWSDKESMLFTNLATATLDFPDRKEIIRRRPNLQLPALDGDASYSSQEEDFYFTCGPDTLSGSKNVLPLVVSVKDGNNLSFDLTFIPKEGFSPENAFFLQGIPSISGMGGTGFTGNPTPGIYYSWPQLAIDTNSSNTMVVDNIIYTITGGGGWMDHQLMMQSLKNSLDSILPIPFTDDPKPYNGWSWQFFNLDNGDAFTGASFQIGDFNRSPRLTYGYYIFADNNLKKWNALFINGDMYLKDFRSFPIKLDDPLSQTLTLPTQWEYNNIETILGVSSFAGIATPWLNNGTFYGQTDQIISENPVDYVDSSADQPSGVGFCESVGFEAVDRYRQRALKYLENSE